uniref:Integrase, catalytic region, zinc finger, CCHC-type, peptidase aspartic, catalytic n=1 Tax=Tanacetum cinerariifolium TaxID=118510 RepID=A0A699HX98_TANCI|nr:integrase, catalytic region, zinc finger, CCHC-type, peptidase aspartic, catalytic [Tanacetum cinerariifolium]
MEISELNANLQEKGVIMAALRYELRKLKGKDLVDIIVTSHTIAPEMLKIDMEPLAPGLLNNRTVHSDYLRLTQEPAVILREVRKIWKPTGKVFTKIGYNWRPIGRTFTIVGNECPLTRITTRTDVTSRKPIALETDTPKPVVTLVYSRKPRKTKTNIPVSKPKIIKSISANNKEPKIALSSPISSMGYGDYQIGNVTISRVNYVEGLGHNLFFDGQFCDSNLEVAFHQHTCFIRNLEEQIMKLSSLIKLCVNIMRSLEFALYEMTLATISSGLVPNLHPSTSFVPPSRSNWDILFQPLFDELLTPSPSVDPLALEVIALIAEEVAPVLAASIGLPSSTIVDQDAPSASNSQTIPETQSLGISNNVEEENQDLNVTHINTDLFFGIPIPENDSKSSSSDVIRTVMHTAAPNSEHVTKWTKDHL